MEGPPSLPWWCPQAFLSRNQTASFSWALLSPSSSHCSHFSKICSKEKSNKALEIYQNKVDGMNVCFMKNDILQWCVTLHLYTAHSKWNKVQIFKSPYTLTNYPTILRCCAASETVWPCMLRPHLHARMWHSSLQMVPPSITAKDIQSGVTEYSLFFHLLTEF